MPLIQAQTNLEYHIKNLKVYFKIIQNSTHTPENPTQKQATSLNARENMNEVSVISAIAQEGSPSMLSHPESLETVTNGRNNGIKRGYHERSNYRIWRFTNFETEYTLTWTET